MYGKSVNRGFPRVSIISLKLPAKANNLIRVSSLCIAPWHNGSQATYYGWHCVCILCCWVVWVGWGDFRKTHAVCSTLDIRHCRKQSYVWCTLKYTVWPAAEQGHLKSRRCCYFRHCCCEPPSLCIVNIKQPAFYSHCASFNRYRSFYARNFST